MQPKFEHTVMYLTDNWQGVMDQMSADGWEMVTVVNFTSIITGSTSFASFWKRPVS